MSSNKIPLVMGVLIGAAGILGGLFLAGQSGTGTPTAQQEEKPLYWVAPMDSNYRRDGPGKSPMGMDLVPVYATQQQAGVVEIAPEVVNNLGVRTTLARRDSLKQVIRTVGYVKYNEDRLIHIHPRVEGWVEKLHVKASGDPVARGQAIYELYSPELVNAQEEFVLALRRNNERLLQAAEDRLRALQLDDEFISALKRDGNIQQTVTFRSPQQGVVDNLNIREGFFVGPNTTLMSIGALDDVWVEAEIFESQAGLVRVGQPVQMQLDYLPGRLWRGQVDYIYPSLEASTRTLRVRLRFDNAEGQLRPNMFARISIETGDDSPTIVIPRDALIRTGNQDRVVLALGSGRFKSIAVSAGRFAGDRVEILSGLQAGEEIVASAQFLLDSESSKSSDFKRMEPMAPETMEVHSGHGEGHAHD
ncbi:efflux RND transporter periplasmic adaptor subunit [Seongchinamella unica]|uniref:Efflux RND transporter periplasmic adaptor subunit n=1 Tax=Seongchinamella unica TaxID=2547392 RepID=A0A4R5LNN6_9GAMM|nr:efflux RND transporter periplasmic adaptor subunit [Seongchinamella unica]